MLSTLLTERPQGSFDTEVDFHNAWLQWAARAPDGYQTALRGGVLASRFSFVFSAGYQSALRHIFPHLTLDGWAAFAVSEDRSQENPQPGVRYQKHAQGYELNGVKTWVAASDFCRHLIISGRGTEGTLYFLVDREARGVQVATRAPGRVLPDLSQGSVRLQSYVSSEHLDAERVPAFAAAEVLYIYTAFLASTWASYPARRSQVDQLLPQAELLCRQKLPEWRPESVRLDQGVQKLLADMRSNEGKADNLWRRDYKLIALYARQASP